MRYNTKATVTVTVELRDVETDTFEGLEDAARAKVNKYLNMKSDRSDYSFVEEVTNISLDDWDCQD